MRIYGSYKGNGLYQYTVFMDGKQIYTERITLRELIFWWELILANLANLDKIRQNQFPPKLNILLTR